MHFYTKLLKFVVLIFYAVFALSGCKALKPPGNETLSVQKTIPRIDKVVLKIHEGSASPKTVKRGKQTTIYAEYTLVLPASYNNQAEVVYQWKLKKGGKLITQSDPVEKYKTARTHKITQPIRIPSGARRGKYTVEMILSCENDKDSTDVEFMVK